MSPQVAVTLGIALGCLLALAALGLKAGRGIRRAAGYCASSHQAPALLIAGTLVSSMLGVLTLGALMPEAFAPGASMAGAFTPGAFMPGAFASGIDAHAWPWTRNLAGAALLGSFCGAGYVVGGLYFGRYLRRSECLSMGEHFGRRFGSPAVQRAVGTITALSLGALLLALTAAAGTLFSDLLSDCLNAGYEAGCLAAWLCLYSVAVRGGSPGVMRAGGLAAALVLAAIIVAALFAILGAAFAGSPLDFEGLLPSGVKGGVESDLASGLANGAGSFLANPSAFFGASLDASPASVSMAERFGGFGALAASGLVLFVAAAVSPWQAGLYLTAKSEHSAMRASALACLLAAFLLAVLGLSAWAAAKTSANLAGPGRALYFAASFIMAKLSGSVFLTVVLATFFGACLATVLSAASTLLSAIGLATAHDALRLKFKDDRDKLRKTRTATLLASLIVLALALALPPKNLGSIAAAGWLGASIMASSLCVIAFGSVWSEALTARGALWSIAAGLAGGAFAKIGSSTGLLPIFEIRFCPFFASLGASLLFAWLGSRGRRPGWTETSVMACMRRIPLRERDDLEFRKTLAFAGALIAAGIASALIAAAFVLAARWAAPSLAIAEAAIWR